MVKRRTQPLKVGNRPNFLACRWHVTYCFTALDKDYNFASNLISIEGLHRKLWASKIARILTLGFSGFPLGSLGTKWHLDIDLMANHKTYYKGEDGGFPQVRAMVSLVSPCLLVAHLNTKSIQTTHYQLVIWFV
jgi:hypothetical protein